LITVMLLFTKAEEYKKVSRSTCICLRANLIKCPIISIL
jgi:hypothetical protein